MKQIPINSIGGGQIAPCVTLHYHKVGAHDIIEANRLPHFGILVISNANPNKPH